METRTFFMLFVSRDTKCYLLQFLLNSNPSDEFPYHMEEKLSSELCTWTRSAMTARHALQPTCSLFRRT